MLRDTRYLKSSRRVFGNEIKIKRRVENILEERHGVLNDAL
jgi:hypothetical protein